MNPLSASEPAALFETHGLVTNTRRFRTFRFSPFPAAALAVLVAAMLGFADNNSSVFVLAFATLLTWAHHRPFSIIGRALRGAGPIRSVSWTHIPGKADAPPLVLVVAPGTEHIGWGLLVTVPIMWVSLLFNLDAMVIALGVFVIGNSGGKDRATVALEVIDQVLAKVSGNRPERDVWVVVSEKCTDAAGVSEFLHHNPEARRGVFISIQDLRGADPFVGRPDSRLTGSPTNMQHQRLLVGAALEVGLLPDSGRGANTRLVQLARDAHFSVVTFSAKPPGQPDVGLFADAIVRAAG